MPKFLLQLNWLHDKRHVLKFLYFTVCKNWKFKSIKVPVICIMYHSRLCFIITGTIAKFLFLQSAKFGNSRISRFLSCVLSTILNSGSSSETLFLYKKVEDYQSWPVFTKTIFLFSRKEINLSPQAFACCSEQRFESVLRCFRKLKRTNQTPSQRTS